MTVFGILPSMFLLGIGVFRGHGLLLGFRQVERPTLPAGGQTKHQATKQASWICHSGSLHPRVVFAKG